MSKPADHTTQTLDGSAAAVHEPDTVEAIAFAAPLILPLVGGVLMFLLAFIAVFLA